MKYLYVVAIATLLGACSDNTQEPSLKWHQQIPSQSIQTVGINDAQVILDSAGLKAFKITDSTDNFDAPKKIYQINDGISTQLEHSENEVILGWYQAEDAIEASQNSLNNAYLLAQAMLGEQGVELMHQISSGKIVKQEIINGYSVSGSCTVNPCMLNIRK